MDVLHILCSDGCFYGDGMFRVAPLSKTTHVYAYKGSMRGGGDIRVA